MYQLRFLQNALYLTSHLLVYKPNFWETELRTCHLNMLMTRGVRAQSDVVFGGLLILGSGLNERTRKQPAGENKGDGPRDEAYEERYKGQLRGPLMSPQHQQSGSLKLKCLHCVAFVWFSSGLSLSYNNEPFDKWLTSQWLLFFIFFTSVCFNGSPQFITF